MQLHNNNSKEMVVCALNAIPRVPKSFPRKKRSLMLCRDDVPLTSTRRRLMFNDVDMAKLDFNVSFSSSKPEDGENDSVMNLGCQENGEEYEEIPLASSPPLLLLENRNSDEEMGKSAVENEPSTPRRGNKMEVAGPQTPSPTKPMQVRGSLNSWIQKLRLQRPSPGNRTLKSWMQMLRQQRPSPEKRTLKSWIEKLRLQRPSPEKQTLKSWIEKLRLRRPSPRKRVSLKVLLKKTKKIKYVHPSNVEKEAFKTWQRFLIEGKPSEYDGDGIRQEISFIQNVRAILGPRVDKPWKGSVLDSIIGALLTQRVHDGTSSSAFMSLGMKFPQYPACDLYSRNHRILRSKRSNSYTLKSFQRRQGNLSRKLVTQRKIAFRGRNRKVAKEKTEPDWKDLREFFIGNVDLERDADTIDSVDWHAVWRANVEDVAKAISSRGMDKKLAIRIKDILNRLASDHGNLDLEWLRYANPEEAKDYLLSIYGIGLKSAECVRLLSLKQPAFPVDVNVGRVTTRLGWVPAPEIKDDILMGLLKKSSKLHNLIHRYLWLRLSGFDNETLYQLHCHMITFGKVFCTKQKPNCSQCPMRFECKYFSNLVDSGSQNSSTLVNSFQQEDIEDLGNTRAIVTKSKSAISISESKRKKLGVKDAAIDVHLDDYTAAPKTPVKAPLRSCQITHKGNSSPDARHRRRTKTTGSRTEHFVYELHDLHPILETFDDRDPDDLSPYLLVTWETDREKPGDTSAENPKSTTIPGTIMIPCRTALKGNFPLNATYFQANEVFADKQTSQIPVDVPCRTLRGLNRKTLYCGANLATIARGRSAMEIRSLFRDGYICTRDFDRETYATNTLNCPLHRPKKENRKEKGF